MEKITELERLLETLHYIDVEGQTKISIRGLECRSEKVKPGYIFFCLEGGRADGHDFIPQAIEAGAVAVVLEKEREVQGASKILVPNVRMAMAVMAELFWGSPSQELCLIGVTGTNGKTTTTHLIEAALRDQSYRTALLGTIKYRIGDEILPVLATTPEAVDLQKILYHMVQKRVEYAVMEVSSHALELNRVSGCDFDIAVYTNITEDHLDFHKNFERYRAAKGKLFSQQGGSVLKGNAPRFAVLNRDDRHYNFFLRQTTVQAVSYGIEKKADVQAENIYISGHGVSYLLRTPWGTENFSLKLTGKFSVYNALAATTVALLKGVPISAIKNSLESVGGISGRFERVDVGQDFLVIIDYAHTPDGLENILQAAKHFVEGNIITIFGCGGERDKGKRPVMGRIAGKYSNYCIITSDNPRGEDPGRIIEEIEIGLRENKDFGSGYAVQSDRFEAIKLGIELARSGDMVIIAGKGHESYQVFSDCTIPFNDREIAAELLAKRIQSKTREKS